MLSILHKSRCSVGRVLEGALLCACALAVPTYSQAAPPKLGPPVRGHVVAHPPLRLPSPTSPLTPPAITAVAGGAFFTLALDADGTVWGWGDNTYGQLGNGATTAFSSSGFSTPARVHNLLGVTSIAGGGFHSMALKSDGTVWAWGSNYFGQIGNGAFSPTASGGVATPVQVSVLSDVIAIAGGGFHSLALTSDGSVWAWGYNQFGQLGSGTFTTTGNDGIATPEPVRGVGGNGFFTNAVAISGGYWHSLALKSDGTVWAWGDNQYGELGIGTLTTTSPYGSATPVQVKGLGGSGFLTNITAIASGTYYNLALKSDGTIWAWGYNGSGQLGNGTMTNSSTPVQVVSSTGAGALTGITAIAASQTGSFSLALDSSGNVWAWGDNYYGELGNGSFTTTGSGGIATPAQVGGLSNATYLSAGSLHSVALDADGTVRTWGSNEYGQLGIGASTTVSPYGIATPVQTLGLFGTVAISGGDVHSVALDFDGTVWTWGDNTNGELGDGTLNDSALAVQTLNLTNVVAVASGGFHNLALISDGTVWSWGDNYYGEVGLGTFTMVAPFAVSMPAQVIGQGGSGFLKDVVAVAAGFYHSLALKSDGTVWAWGTNGAGQLGNGGFTTAPSTGIATPAQVNGLSGVVAIAGGYGHSVALKSDGTVWAWGDNFYGQLGNGSFTTTSNGIPTPVQVSGISNVTAIACGRYNTIALKSDGTVWAWGDNQYGQLGNGTFMGSGGYGNVCIPVPEQVKGVAGSGGYLTNVIAITSGQYYGLALEVGGTVWGWGYDSDGELGYGAFFPNAPYGLSTSVEVLGFNENGHLTGITAIAGGGMHGMALSSGGLVYTWGNDQYGQLGDYEYNTIPYPVLVVGLE